MLGDPFSTKRLEHEARTWSEEVRHKNVLPVLGYFVGTDDYFNVISAYMQNGTLAEFEHRVRRGKGTWKIVRDLFNTLRAT